MTGTKLWRLSLAAILGFGWLFLVPQNAYATCVNFVQSQAIAAAYTGDAEPTVHTMDTCGGDDVSYQIPIATTITFDGRQYDQVYATTNSVITFGRPDGTYWNYPSTPSISLYSMDWVSGYGVAQDTLNISYSEGGFQLGLQVIPFGQWNAPTASNINIIVAITNSGGISVAYSYQGPEYPNLRTGVRLHDGSIVSLEAWGATQIQPGSSMPTLQADPVSGSVTNPEPAPIVITPEQQQAQVVEATQLANDINNINNLIASINGEETTEPEVIPDPEPTSPVTPPTEEPDVIVEPEIVTPEDPRFPDEEQQTEPESPNPSPSSDTTNEENATQDPTPEPSEEPAPQPEDTVEDPVVEPNQSGGEEAVDPSPDNTIIDIGIPISEEELNKLNKLIKTNDAKLMSAVSNLLTSLSPTEKSKVADNLGVKTSEIQLIAEAVKSNPVLAAAVVEFSNRAQENTAAPMPYTLADATTEIAAEQFLSDPIGALTNIDFEKILNPSEWGKDMTDDQREKAQEVIVPVIIASNIIAAAMTRRI